MNINSGEKFLYSIYSDLLKDRKIISSSIKSKSKEKEIRNYLNRLDRISKKLIISNNKYDLLKKIYFNKYIIKELPDTYVESRKKQLLLDGKNPEITDIEKEVMLKNIRDSQKESLESWIDFLILNDEYPMWFREYVFEGAVRLGRLDKNINNFYRRNPSTTAAFIELNTDVISILYDLINRYITDIDSLNLNEKVMVDKGLSFRKLYITLLNEEKKIYGAEKGKWIKYDKLSDSNLLIDSLVGKNTGWCTISSTCAKTQLMEGDFYIFFTQDKNGEYKVPRIGIRADNKDILEVRGVSTDQNLEPQLINILERKLKEFNPSSKTNLAISDMKQLNKISVKQTTNQNLLLKDLLFLYEIEKRINSLGLKKDPRIDKIREERNIINDLNYIFSNKKIFNNNLYLNYLKEVKGLILPKVVNGDLVLNNIESIEDVIFPRIINGRLSLINVPKKDLSKIKTH